MLFSGLDLAMESVTRYSLIKIDSGYLLTNGKMPGIDEFTKEFFDQSSEAWMANKIRTGHSMAYICKALTKQGNPCKRPATTMKDALSEHVCKQHRKYGINKMAKDH